MTNQLRILIAAAFLLGSIGLSVYYADKLPSRVPIHFDGTGVVNGWGPKKGALIFPPALEAVLALLYAAAIGAVQNRKYLERKMRKPLSGENLELLMKKSAAVIDWVIILAMGLFLDTQLESFLIATRRTQQLSPVFFALLALILIGVAVSTVRMLLFQRRIAK